MFTVDGMRWPVPCDIAREAQIKASDISGMLLDRTIFTDVLGTYMRYTVRFECPFGSEATYDALYELLSDPVSVHTFILPYGPGWMSLMGTIESVQDKWLRMPGGASHWAGATFDVVGANPVKYMTLEEAIERSTVQWPDVEEVAEGDTYMWNGAAWELVTYRNADLIAY